MDALATFRVGDAVIIAARTEFYTYLDGRRGRVKAVGPMPAGDGFFELPAGYARVEAQGDTVPLELLVPLDELRLDLGARRG